jgi:hypothetical protein
LDGVARTPVKIKQRLGNDSVTRGIATLNERSYLNKRLAMLPPVVASSTPAMTIVANVLVKI